MTRYLLSLMFTSVIGSCLVSCTKRSSVTYKFDESGETYATGEFGEHDFREGSWTIYEDGGQVEKKGLYSANLLSGVWNYKYPEKTFQINWKDTSVQPRVLVNLPEGWSVMANDESILTLISSDNKSSVVVGKGTFTSGEIDDYVSDYLSMFGSDHHVFTTDSIYSDRGIYLFLRSGNSTDQEAIFAYSVFLREDNDMYEFTYFTKDIADPAAFDKFYGILGHLYIDSKLFLNPFDQQVCFASPTFD